MKTPDCYELPKSQDQLWLWSVYTLTLQHAIDDLGRKKPLLTGLHESYADLASLSDDPALLQPIKEQVDDIALTWERVSTRLANRLKNMQVCSLCTNGWVVNGGRQYMQKKDSSMFECLEVCCDNSVQNFRPFRKCFINMVQTDIDRFKEQDTLPWRENNGK